MTKKIMVSAGGTGGHIIPALSVCKALINKGAEVYYIGNENSMEYEIINKNNIPFLTIDVQKLYRSLTFKHLLFPYKLLKSIIKSIKYFNKIKPDAFIGFGGFVAGPPAVAAWLCRCPIYLQEQNCKPGLTNKWTAKFAKGVFLAFEEGKKYFKGINTFITGNPVSIQNNTFPIDSDNKETIDDSSRKKLLILGGSQGSLYINNLILENLEWFQKNNIDLLWQTGKKHLETVNEALNNKKYILKNINEVPKQNIFCDFQSVYINDCQKIYTFDFTNEIHQIYRNSDFIISRGGALTLSEIEIHRIPVFVVPLSTAAVNEQFYNALSIEKRNMGTMFEEKNKNLFPEKFEEFTKKALFMYQNNTQSIHLSAAENIVKILLEEK
ncbi:MAG: undecaprenyldiphospho-muramoylpentapeptide beta-N-acetylglucosaminyltransferase [Candidatus Cloacimonetes bacterium]|nr:undecaprenyldiphospho-muramoylpentapeptide beta-N-acetylglucosaminyltransferase [Candidatus Cloacimonadota bacterium]